MSILIISTADWNAPLWTNKQFMTLELSKSHKIIYLEPMPLRNPSITFLDIKRLVSRIIYATKYKQPQNNIQVISPIVIPLFSKRYKRFLMDINIRLLNFQLKKYITELQLIWTFSPIIYGLEVLDLPIVYHAVDLLHEIPLNYKEDILMAERKLAFLNRTLAIGSSSKVVEHLLDMKFENVYFWPNVAKLLVENINIPELRTKSVVFAGNLVDYKINYDLINGLIRAFPQTIFHFIGPDDKKSRIISTPNVVNHGLLSQRDTHEILNKCAVGIIPYLINDYTLGVLPLKIFEYLQSGLFVLSTALPSLLSLELNADIVHICNSTEDMNKVLKNLLNGEYALQRASDIGERFTWKNRGIEARNLVESLLVNES